MTDYLATEDPGDATDDIPPVTEADEERAIATL